VTTANHVLIDGEYYSPNHPRVRARVSEYGPEKKAELLKSARDTIAKSRRIRQDSKPLLNKLEQEYYNILCTEHPRYPRPRPQAKRYKLGNGIWYKPDFTASVWPSGISESETAWEVKGPFAYRGGLEALKTAAHQWPEVAFYLVWKENGEWKEQRVLP
jgi:hypothetical protein